MDWKEPEQRFIENCTKSLGFTRTEIERKLVNSKVEIIDGKIIEIDTREVIKSLCFESVLPKGDIIKELVQTADPYLVDFTPLSNIESLCHGDFEKYLNKKTLNLSTFTKLKRLSLIHSIFESIELSQCSELEHIYARGCDRLKKIDISNNKRLKHISLMSGEIKSLDFTKNYLLEEIGYYGNELKEVQLAKNNSIRSLSLRGKYSSLPLEECKKIQKLTVDLSNLDKLDLSKNKNLRSLRLNSGNLKLLDISSLHSLNSLTLTNANIEKIIFNDAQRILFKQLRGSAKISINEEQADYLKRLELHTKAAMHNWDEGLDPLKKILKNPLCDRATALSIYWKGGAFQFIKYNKISEVPEISRTEYRFLKKLEKQLLEGKFPQKRLPFDPKNIDGHNFLEESIPYESEYKHIHDTFKETFDGEYMEIFDLDILHETKFSS